MGPHKPLPKCVKAVTTRASVTKSKYDAHFECFEDSNKQKWAVCKHCNKKLSRKNYGTKSIKSHLEKLHRDLVDVETPEVVVLEESAALSPQDESNAGEADETEKAKENQQLITDYFSKEWTEDATIEAAISRLITIDGFAISKFTESKDLRDLLIARFGTSKVPRSRTTITTMLHEYSEKVRLRIRQTLADYLKNGNEISITTDEWKSAGRRRYVNINVVGSKKFFCNLGLVRIVGSAPSSILWKLIEDRLAVFGLKLNQITSVITDGARVNIRMVQDSGKIHQICHAHGIHLAISDIFYQKQVKTRENLCNQSTDNAPSSEEFSEFVLADNIDESAAEESGLFFAENCEIDEAEITDEILKPIVKKLRSLIIQFRNPTNDQILQEYVFQQEGKRMELLLDVTNRWNSLVTMIKRAVKLKSCIMKASVDAKIKNVLSEDEFQVLEHVCSGLQAVEVASDAICRREADLLTADAALQFMIDELKGLAKLNNWSAKLLNNLRTRVKERRTKYSGILFYLHSSKLLEDSDILYVEDSENLDFLQPLSRSFIQKELHELLSRFTTNDSFVCEANLFEEGTANNSSQACSTFSETDVEMNAVTSPQNDMANKLQMYVSKIQDSAKLPTQVTVTSLEKLIRTEMTVWEEEGKRGRHLTKAYKMLSSIKPTSVLSEQSFSAAGQFVTKLRTRIGDGLLDDLCFLRSYFQQIRAMKSDQ